MDIVLQGSSDRHYKLENCIVKLRCETVETAKYWNQRYLCNIYDSTFVNLLAKDVFGLDLMATSSVFGGRTWNSKVQHAALDTVKVKFLRGNNDYFLLSLRHSV